MQRIFSDLSIEKMLADTRYLTEETPMRLAGSAMERKAAEYIKGRFEEFDVPMDIHEFDAFVSFPHSARVEVISPERRTLEARAFAQAAPTPPEGVEAELIHVGSGGLNDYADVDAGGKITLSELSFDPPRPEKVRIATLNGSVGQIMMNWGLPEHNTVPMGTCKAIWGNPTTLTAERMPRIPAVGIRRADGMWLAELAKKGPVKVRVFCDTENRWGKILLPLGRIEGAVEPEKFVLVGGHYDAWAGGATDNATGNAQMIEMARVFAKHRKRLRRSIVFAFWPAHESGIMEGSTWYADKYWDDIVSNCVFSLNVDSDGMLDAVELRADCSPELFDFHKRLAADVLDMPNHVPRTLGHTGDQSFFGAGISSIFAKHEHPVALKKHWNGARHGWWYHSELDQMDKVDPDLLLSGTKLYAAYVHEFAFNEILPQDFTLAVAPIEARARDLTQYDVEINLAAVVDQIAILKTKTAAVKAYGQSLAGTNEPKKIRDYNEMVQTIARGLTPVTSTVVGKWDQDTYGLTALTSPLPGLFEIPRMAAAGKDSDFYRLQWGDTIRQRNRIVDELTVLNGVIDQFLETTQTSSLERRTA